MSNYNAYNVQMTRVAWRSWVLVCEFGDVKFVVWGTRRHCYERFKAWRNPNPNKALV